MVSGYKTIWKVTLGVGISKRFGLGFCLDTWGASLDIGPVWFYIEW